MSVKCVAWVLHESRTKGNDRMVLVIIADEADNDGRDAFPSVDRIAACANVHRSTVLRSLVSLEAQGELLIRRPKVHGPGKHNRYILPMGANPVTVADAVGWGVPKLRADVAAYWSQTATDSAHVIPLGTTPGEIDADDDESVAQRSHLAKKSVAPGATRPRDPVDAEIATRPNGGQPRRRGLDPVPPSPLDAVAAAARRNYALQAERDAGVACHRCGNVGMYVDEERGGAVPCDHDVPPAADASITAIGARRG